MIGLTNSQMKALDMLNKAFKAAKSSGLTFCGMDGEVIYASKQGVEKYAGKESIGGDYCEVARARYEADLEKDNCCGTVKTHNAYKDSGGW